MTEQLLVRKLPDGTKARLVERARFHGRKESAEVEARELFRETLESREAPLQAFFDAADRFRAEFGGVDLTEIKYDHWEPQNPFEEQ